jgi:hypothetical protein
MNLFLAGWNLPIEYRSKALIELQRMGEVYPRLDPKTIWSYGGKNGSVFAASMHTNDQASAPRQYVHRDENHVVFYSGLPVHSSGKFSAHRSEALSSRWDQLTEDIEGMFCVVRAFDNPSKLELLTDIVGMEQIYYFHRDNLWLISNSVRLIERIVGPLAMDPEGISLTLSSDWAWDDLTLLANVRTIPGGQQWTWVEGENEPRIRNYYSPSRLAGLSHKKFTQRNYKELSDKLIQVVSNLSNNFENVNCALTGGRDSRLVSVFFIHAGLPVRYYTFGEPSGTDAKIAQQIASQFNLNYRMISVPSSEVISNWDDECRQIVVQSDGMASIDLIASRLSCLKVNDHQLFVDVGGTGGELGKGFYSRPDLDFFLNRFDLEKMKTYLGNLIPHNYGGLISQEAEEIARNRVHNFVQHYTDLGFAPSDMPDLFFLYSRLRRKRGTNKRVYMEYQDFFTPYMTRSFIEAIFSMTAVERFFEPFHYNIIRLLSPELHSMPLDSGPWKSQKLSEHLIKFYRNRLLSSARKTIRQIRVADSHPKKTPKKPHTATDMFDSMSWFNAKRGQMREFCLDQNASPIWTFVNRSAFERISSPDADYAELNKYGHYVSLFYKIATLFYYEESLKNRLPET